MLRFNELQKVYLAALDDGTQLSLEPDCVRVDGRPFVACAKYAGPRREYVFKTGPCCIGYYHYSHWHQNAIKLASELRDAITQPRARQG